MVSWPGTPSRSTTPTRVAVTDTERVPAAGPAPVPPALWVAATTTISATTTRAAATRTTVVRRGDRRPRPGQGQVFDVITVKCPAVAIQCVTKRPIPAAPYLCWSGVYKDPHRAHV